MAIMAMVTITTSTAGGRKQARSMPMPKKMAINAAILGRRFIPHHSIFARQKYGQPLTKPSLLYYMKKEDESDAFFIPLIKLSKVNRF